MENKFSEKKSKKCAVVFCGKIKILHLKKSEQGLATK